MNLNALKHFYWVVREGGFSAASRVLKVAQPGLSRSVKILEEDFGAQLFDRQAKNLKLSALGSTVFRYCMSIFEAEERIAALKSDGKMKVDGTLEIASGDSIAQHFLPAILAEYAKAFPNVYARVSTGPTAEMLERIAGGSVDLGLFFHVPDPGPLPVEIKKIQALPFRLVVLAKHFKNPKVLESFIGSREIDSQDTRHYPTLDKLRKIYPDASIRYSSNLLLLHKELVMEGLGVGILPEFLIAQELKKRIVKDVLPEEDFRFQLKLVTSSRRHLKMPAEEFMKIFFKKMGIALR